MLRLYTQVPYESEGVHPADGDCTASIDGRELRSGLARALEAFADVTRGQTPSTLERDVAELRERVEYLEDSLAVFGARAERDDAELRPWNEVRR